MAHKSEHQAIMAGGDRARRLYVVAADTPQPVRRRVAVLYVEDDGGDVLFLGRQLAGLGGYEVDYVPAATLADARLELARQRFDIIFCDFWLEAETTVSFIGELKATADAVPVVLVSSLENDDIELIGRRAGADGFVAKDDLNAGALARLFATLVDRPAERPAPADGGVARWLKALLRSLDRVHAASSLAMVESGRGTDRLSDLLDEIVGNSTELRADILDKLAGLERATRRGAVIDRFDAVPHIDRAVRRQSARARHGAVLGFRMPRLPVEIETDPTLFGDLVEGFLAEAGDCVACGLPAEVRLTVGAGRLDLAVVVGKVAAAPGAGDGELAAAAAGERRALVETLARSVGGRLTEDDGPGILVRLDLPLRPS